MRHLLNRCMEEHRSVEIIYLSEKGELSQRVIRIEGMTNTHVFGYCHLRRRQRKFKLDNMLSIQPLSVRKAKWIS